MEKPEYISPSMLVVKVAARSLVCDSPAVTGDPVFNGMEAEEDWS